MFLSNLCVVFHGHGSHERGQQMMGATFHQRMRNTPLIYLKIPKGIQLSSTLRYTISRHLQ